MWKLQRRLISIDSCLHHVARRLSVSTIAVALVALVQAPPAGAQGSAGIQGAVVGDPLASVAPRAAGARILLFNTQNGLVDAVGEITLLGGIYTVTSDPFDLNLSNMRRFDIVWIGSGAGFANWGSRCAHLNAYVREGRTLVINQPDEVGLVPCLPADLRVVVTDIFGPASGTPSLDAPHLCFTEGKTSADLPPVADIVPSALLGSGWTTVSSQPPLASMLYARRNGQIFFMNSCFGGRTDSGGCSFPNASFAFRDSLIGCLKQRMPAATCEIGLNKASFTNGETIVVQSFRVVNRTDGEVAIEIKTSLDAPGLPPLPGLNFGSRGRLLLPPGYDADLEPVPLVTVGPATVRDTYGLTCRLVNPVTGETLHEDVNVFRIR
jgi:hypothetical protein